MSKSFDVCIRGGGVVGRTLALLLARERLRVALVAPAPSQAAASDVRAYALNGASRRVLEGLRAWPDAALATPVTHMRVWGDDGGALNFNVPVAASGASPAALAWIVDVPALEQQLHEACRYQGQIEILDAPATAALTVICEGQKSHSRSEFATGWSHKPYPQKAIAARLHTELAHHGVARQWFSGGDILALLPMEGPNGNSVALVWSVSAARADVLENMSLDAFCAELHSLCGLETGALRLSSDRSSWPLALSQADHWVGPGWALAGDAAHTVHPLAGQGLNLGLADAACLASVIAAREYWRGLGDEKLLRRYERARKGDTAAVGAVTDGLHNLFAQQSAPWQALRNWGMKGFAASTPLKNWLAQRAAGL